jgi:hypothetical protein
MSKESLLDKWMKVGDVGTIYWKLVLLNNKQKDMSDEQFIIIASKVIEEANNELLYGTSKPDQKFEGLENIINKTKG